MHCSSKVVYTRTQGGHLVALMLKLTLFISLWNLTKEVSKSLYWSEVNAVTHGVLHRLRVVLNAFGVCQEIWLILLAIS